MQLVHVEALSVASDVDGVVGPLLYWGVVLLIVQMDPGLIVVGAIEMPGRGEAVDLAGADHVVVDPFTSMHAMRRRTEETYLPFLKAYVVINSFVLLDSKNVPTQLS